MVALKKIIIFANRMKWQNLTKNEIIIFDAAGSELLEQAVLPDRDCYILKARNEEFTINANILYFWISKIVTSIFKGNFSWVHPLYSIKRYYFYSILEDVSPKIVITFVDNSCLFQWLSRHYKKAVFIAVQNGLRAKTNVHHSLLDCAVGFGRVISMPYYFCFGEFEKELHEKYGHQIDAYFPVGSLKAAFFQEKYNLLDMSVTYDLCLISEWHPSIMMEGNHPCIKQAIEILAKNLKHFLQKHSFSVIVALASDSQEEREWFAGALEPCSSKIVFSVRNSGMSPASYVAGVQSHLCVCSFSTLGLELLGFGKKVLFCDYSGLGGERISSSPFPDICLTKDNTYESFENSVLDLLNTDTKEYLELTRSWKKYRMNYMPEKPTHHCIREKIESYLGCQ